MTKTIISWDLGATKCAAAIVKYDSASSHLHCEKTYTTKIATHTSLENLIDDLEAGLDISMSDADAVCVGGAGQYDGNVLNLEAGYPYEMSFAKSAEKRRWPSFAVIHDYAPIVCATFTSYMNDINNVKRLNDSPLHLFGRRVALGVGTGLGLKDGVLFENGDFWLGHNEIGHIGIVRPAIKESFYQERHSELIKFLLSEHILRPHESLTFERILTGQGMVKLYQFFYPTTSASLTPEELAEKIYSGDAKEALALFAWYLGLFTGMVQLTFMPEGGIWITGGVILNHLNTFEHAEFQHGIESTPGYMDLRKNIPLGVLCSNNHAFMGAGYYASKRLL